MVLAIVVIAITLILLLLTTETVAQKAEAKEIIVPAIVKKELTPEEKIREAFKDTPRMISIVKCESEFRQFVGTSTPLVSKTFDVGIMQINQVHWKKAKELGLDIFNSIDENIEMGKIILDKQGLNAWTCHKMI